MTLIRDFYALHRIPELDCTLPKTCSYVKRCLSVLRCNVTSPTTGSLCAYFDFGQEDALAFRADMDALPIEEATGLHYSSVHAGQMHACGHDGHTAILLELARRLHQKKTLSHNILLIFQPGEEQKGGAGQLCDSGIFEQYKVRAIFGLHLWPKLTKGKIHGKSGAMMAQSSGITACFEGKSCHIASKKEGVDALFACCRFYEQACALRASAPHLLAFGKLEGGTAGNVVCDRAVLYGSLRCFHPRVHSHLRKRLLTLWKQVAADTGCSGALEITEGYPAVYNDASLFSAVCRVYPVAPLLQKSWAAEDFSFYQQKVPGAFFFLGLGDTPALHSPQFCFDPDVLQQGVRFFETLCEKIT